MEIKTTGTRFLQLSFSLLLLLLTCSLIFPKANSFVALNFYHTDLLNRVFLAITFLGDGLFPLIVTLIAFIWKKNELAIKVLFSFLASGIIAQLLKALFHAPRPKAFFSMMHYPYQNFIEGVTHSGMNSFPSGHTTTVFALAATLAFNTSCKYRCMIYFILATLTLYSRIYLGQHFMEDTAAGLFIGTSIAFVGEWLAKRIHFRMPARKENIQHESFGIDI